MNLKTGKCISQQWNSWMHNLYYKNKLVVYLDAYPYTKRNFSFCLIHILWIGLKSYNHTTLVPTFMEASRYYAKENWMTSIVRNGNFTWPMKWWSIDSRVMGQNSFWLACIIKKKKKKLLGGTSQLMNKNHDIYPCSWKWGINVTTNSMGMELLNDFEPNTSLWWPKIEIRYCYHVDNHIEAYYFMY